MGFHGGGVELFSSEVISSLKEVGWKEAQCVRRLELQKGLSPWWKESWSGGRVGDLRGTVAWGQLPVGQNIRGGI